MYQEGSEGNLQNVVPLEVHINGARCKRIEILQKFFMIKYFAVLEDGSDTFFSLHEGSRKCVMTLTTIFSAMELQGVKFVMHVVGDE